MGGGFVLQEFVRSNKNVCGTFTDMWFGCALESLWVSRHFTDEDFARFEARHRERSADDSCPSLIGWDPELDKLLLDRLALRRRDWTSSYAQLQPGDTGYDLWQEDPLLVGWSAPAMTGRRHFVPSDGPGGANGEAER